MKFKTEYKKLIYLDIGGNWGYVLMHIRDDKGVKKLRLSKCRKYPGFPKTEKYLWQEIDPVHIEHLSQVGKINFKKEQEIETIFQKLKEELKLLYDEKE
ncbi:MAG: hypothetical protein ACFFBP_21075 [Promethearchaeota archaeon]